MSGKAYISGDLKGHNETEIGNINMSDFPEFAVLASGYAVLEDAPKCGVQEGYVETCSETDGEMTPDDIHRIARELVAADPTQKTGFDVAMAIIVKRTAEYNVTHEKEWGR
jgi:hypothetical protein